MILLLLTKRGRTSLNLFGNVHSNSNKSSCFQKVFIQMKVSLLKFSSIIVSSTSFQAPPLNTRHSVSHFGVRMDAVSKEEESARQFLEDEPLILIDALASDAFDDIVKDNFLWAIDNVQLQS